MLVYLIRRLGQALLVMAAMATLVFLALYTVGDPVDMLANPDADFAERAAIAQRLGLDRPLPEQFLTFLGNAIQGDLGRSFVYNAPAVEVILQRLPATMELALAGLVFSILIGVPLGVLAG
jgi:peptide/nickel transport system permease protein